MSTEISQRFPENLAEGWKALLGEEIHKEYFKKLVDFIKKERARSQPVYPESQHVLRALQGVPYDAVKVVILGQDPYHGAGQAMGLSFAVPNNLTPKPPSLGNIFKELESDLDVPMKGAASDLLGWQEQGVLLLNTVLTVRAQQAFSHRDKGWELFTDQIIRALDKREKPMLFILWGAAAQKKKLLLSSGRHGVIESAHPSPLSAHRGFMGSRPFSKANAWLELQGLEKINWAQTGLV
jgi:uracil-DNA glycosylase